MGDKFLFQNVFHWFHRRSFDTNWSFSSALPSASVSGEMFVLIRGCSIVHCLFPDREVGRQREAKVRYGDISAHSYCHVCICTIGKRLSDLFTISMITD